MTIELLVQILLAACGFLLVFFIQQINEKLGKACESVSELNTKIAVIIQRVDSHEKRITKLEV